ncbi:hypothetical protein GCT19_41370 [Paraburkholderia sp. CNPSo 3155]|uniref:Uncharacterized protein n=1 Tax=Paraburkholderia atlantica TaxID=2654982 RepID=A0A6I1Q2R2_PARAM|nr:hypothetical protein [Paraburkholderia atlantica]MBB5429877.1 hypothetical protein [Paraburkholderia atlantica]MPW11737.1 hypothetical protein [Paraburkholderia atlantica]NUY36128.1 hypothetical protein [Paraburkholderia atlantica]
MADVRQHADGATIVVLESGVIFNGRPEPDQNQAAKHNCLVSGLATEGVDSCRIAIVETQAQKTQDDCVMYSLTYVLKAHKNREIFDRLHARLNAGANPDTSGESRNATSLRVMEEISGTRSQRMWPMAQTCCLRTSTSTVRHDSRHNTSWAGQTGEWRTCQQRRA